MTATAQRRPITSHPAFAPLIGLWFAALLGLTIAVLPAAVLENWLSTAGIDGLAPLTLATRVVMGVLAAAIGALAGYALTRRLAGHDGGDPRPRYAEADLPREEPVDEAPVRRRPLRVREELADEFGDESQVGRRAPETGRGDADAAAPRIFAAPPQTGENFMILTPQPIHPPRPAPDLEALLEQFDSVFAAFRAGGPTRGGEGDDGSAADPVQAFVARQTGVPVPSPSPVSRPYSIGGLVPDHQAELRAALDKLARSQRKE